MTVESKGGLEDSDYLRIYKIVDGSETLVHEIKGDQSLNTYKIENISGSTLQIKLTGSVSSAQEKVIIDNLLIQYEDNSEQDLERFPWKERFQNQMACLQIQVRLHGP